MNSGKEKLDFVCFGGGDWWYHNHGHIDMQLMRRFARIGTTLYVNSIVMQKLKIGQGKTFVQKAFRKVKSILKGLRKSDFGFWVYSPFSLPMHHVPWLRQLNEILLRGQLWVAMLRLGIRNPLVWVTCPASCNVAIKMKKIKLTYGRIDRWEDYPNVDIDTIIQYDRKLKAKADLTVFVSEILYDQEHQQCKKAFFLDHGVDFDIFARAEGSEELPPDIRDIKHPIVGFFGGIDDHTSDMNLLKRVIDLLPEINFVFVGKASVDCTGLFSQKNVRMLGQKPYEQIPHYGKCFDVAIMPWRQNRWIEACNPIKLKEYLALGKPIVSTPFAELQKYRDVVYVAKTVNEFADCIKRALSENTPELAARRRQKVAHASWDSKAELALHELIPEKGSKPKPLAHDVKKTL